MTELSAAHYEFLMGKGIDSTSIAEAIYNVHSEGDYIVFPYPNSTKRRLCKQGVDRKFTMEGAIDLFVPTGGIDSEAKTVFLCEGETDTLCLAGYVEAPVVGISGVNGWKPTFTEAFANAEIVYVILDNDADYNVAAKTDKAWETIRADLGKKAVRVILPEGCKDVCDFFLNFQPEVLTEVLEDARNPVIQYHYKALDLTEDPPGYDWLVNPYIAKGDLVMLLGQSGVGKSWISMSLSVAIAEGHDEWLGFPLTSQNNRVYYIDEENPRDVIYSRLAGLGLTDLGADNIRYLSDAGVRLDRNPKHVLDEAVAWEPSLIVLDSLTRFHSGSENDAGQMAKLLNDGIRPLARATGASVLLLHHENKGDSSNAYVRARGTTDIPASIDAGIRVAAFGESGFSFTQFKSRRTAERKEKVTCQIMDTPEGITISRLQTMGKLY